MITLLAQSLYCVRNGIAPVAHAGPFESPSIASLNTRKLPTEAESKTIKSGPTRWTLDLTVKRLSDPICLPPRAAEAGQLLRKCANRGVNVFFQRSNQVPNLRKAD